jgi:hypothetical protein
MAVCCLAGAATCLPAPAAAEPSSPAAAAAGLRFFFFFDASKIASRSCGEASAGKGDACVVVSELVGEWRADDGQKSAACQAQTPSPLEKSHAPHPRRSPQPRQRLPLRCSPSLCARLRVHERRAPSESKKIEKKKPPETFLQLRFLVQNMR